jgi:plastocyanin
MKLTKLIFVSSVIILLGVGCAKAPAQKTNTNQPPAVGTSRSVPASGEMTVTMDSQTGEFVPVTSFVKVGTKVTFKNTDTKPHWIASDPHPTHTDLPGFDAKAPIAPGESYTYTFDKVGHWLFHDHLNPAFGGAVEVIQ